MARLRTEMSGVALVAIAVSASFLILACEVMSPPRASSTMKVGAPGASAGLIAEQQQLRVFQKLMSAQSLALAEARKVAPPQERVGLMPTAPSRLGKGTEKRLRIVELRLAEAMHEIAEACDVSTDDVEALYRRGLEEGWPGGTSDEDLRVIENCRSEHGGRD